MIINQILKDDWFNYYKEVKDGVSDIIKFFKNRL